MLFLNSYFSPMGHFLPCIMDGVVPLKSLQSDSELQSSGLSTCSPLASVAGFYRIHLLTLKERLVIALKGYFPQVTSESTPRQLMSHMSMFSLQCCLQPCTAMSSHNKLNISSSQVAHSRVISTLFPVKWTQQALAILDFNVIHMFPCIPSVFMIIVMY